MTYRLHRQAATDLESAFEFDRRHGSAQVALRFLAEFERIAELVGDNPDIGTPTHKGRRRYPFKRIPCSIINRPVSSVVRILVIRHDRQVPGYGGGRG
jgi:plasmid stabilization system protein ParE